MYKIDYNSYRSVKGFNRRIRFLVMHYTAADFSSSVKFLAGDGGVSAHYLVPDPTEKTYINSGFKDMRIFNLVDEGDRAWHAGISSWQGRSSLNDTSIGIEIVYLAKYEHGEFVFPLFKQEQIEAVKILALNIIQRYPDILPINVIGHSDIAVGRKSDPGPLFPWFELYQCGVGAWYDDETKNEYYNRFCKEGIPTHEDIISKMKTYGYDISSANTDDGYQKLVRAFQLHFRQKKYDGRMDNETAAILFSLVDKYIR
ncbi:N-acetylmuramoyl-L-alanine amidase [Aliivibrio fischeri]|uniref:N-acetylmuramoyl-L-alanine amidase n=1 Tax=Aliivibrio fischeri TaxID=668 RepID=A0A510UND3_ALIFS|nr:N-acetylmuramoyl-L-alanine amidase [Aliivibrio fischeri]MUK51565.1 N-acetylmuramoyl-L-alanine amidase [Aliivibrio fischeri]GEK16172.1 N-acetylmuramoyl-L-alanine amidase [Aliivibrio fischeri]